MHPSVAEALESIDAAVFSGELLYTDLVELERYLGRWNRAVEEHRKAEAEDAAKCRRCSECANSTHHWMENSEYGNHEGPIQPHEAEFCCKHCPATGDECPDCSGEGIGPLDDPCETCGGAGVVERDATAN